jgi:hypothetical protein
MSAFDQITLDNGVRELTIQTNRDALVGATAGFYITDLDGLLDPGQSTGSAQGNGLADGSILDKGVPVSGKTLTMNIYMEHEDREVLRSYYTAWIDFLKVKNFTLTTDWLGPYTCQYVSFILDEDGKGKNKDKHFKGTLTLVTEESW